LKLDESQWPASRCGHFTSQERNTGYFLDWNSGLTSMVVSKWGVRKNCCTWRKSNTVFPNHNQSIYAWLLRYVRSNIYSFMFVYLRYWSHLNWRYKLFQNSKPRNYSILHSGFSISAYLVHRRLSNWMEEFLLSGSHPVGPSIIRGFHTERVQFMHTPVSETVVTVATNTQQTLTRLCRFWGSHSCGYEEFCQFNVYIRFGGPYRL
jgi:hypothetical protein